MQMLNGILNSSNGLSMVHDECDRQQTDRLRCGEMCSRSRSRSNDSCYSSNLLALVQPRRQSKTTGPVKWR